MRTSIMYYFVIRLRFILWRVRQIIFIFVTYFLWYSIFEGKRSLFGYTQAEILTYILLATLISNFVMSTETYMVANDINSGDIINYILKPLSFFKYNLARDSADKLINVFFTIFEIMLIVWLFKPSLYFNGNGTNILTIIVFVLLGTLIAFFINLSLSFIAFWTTEAWAIQFVYFILVGFLSGAYFPLDILPKPIFYFLLATPFPYLYYLPTKIYIRGTDWLLPIELVMCCLWIIFSYYIARFLWEKGLRSYNFVGR